MNDHISLKLWVTKFCLKIVYPKHNFYMFLVFLAIKYRILYYKTQLSCKNMETFKLKTLSNHVQRLLLKDHLERRLHVLLDKCVIISKEEFIQLASENLFYVDNGVLWIAMKLTPEMRHKYKENSRKHTNIYKFNLNFMTSEIHRKLWNDSSHSSVKNIRIVPVVGSKLVQEKIAFITENEYYNIKYSFDIDKSDNVEVSLHPLPSFDCTPKIAAKAEVSLIVNDYDLSNDFIKEILNNHFEVPKLMSINDVFSIELTQEITGKYHYKYFDMVESMGKLHFKCRKLNGDVAVVTSDGKIATENSENIVQSFFIVRGVTQLTLGENVHMLKPRDEYFKQKENKDNNLHLLKLCPSGLKQKFKQIQETIVPFLTEDLNELSSSMSSPIIPMLLLTGSMGSGRHLLVKTLSKYNGMNYLQMDCNALQSSTAKQTESKINAMIQKAKAATPVMVLLDNFEVFAVDPENNEDCRVMEYFTNSITDLYQNYTKHPIVFIAVTERSDLKPNIQRIFLEKFHINRPNVDERFEMLKWFVSAMQLNIDNEREESVRQELIINDLDDTINKHTKEVLQRVAAKTEMFLYGDMDTLMHFAVRESYLKQQNDYNHLPPNLNLCDLREEDFNCALESIRSLQSHHLDAPKIPKVYWEDIGGLDKLKKELLKTIEFPIKYPHLFKNSSLKRSGILLYGPPGCGKTLIAKAVSTELNVSFLSVKGPELLNMYIGQSEENVRKVFESARASSPCIVFLDELDALAPRRGAAGDSAGASDRVVSQLLAEVDGVASEDDADSFGFVFIMGATNRPDLLEQSLLRPGRLDKLVYVGPYGGLQEKTLVLKALCRSYKLRPEVNLGDVAAALPDRCTGADLLQVVSTARSAAVRSLVTKLNAGTVKESELSTDSVILGVSELWQGVESFQPSVTEEELAYYESLQSQM